MEQNGADDEGILGFLEKDMKKCVLGSASNKCFYCDKKSASIMCKRKLCRRTFHVICGVRNGCLFQFTERFDSYCHQHHGIKYDENKEHDKCMICWERLGEYNPIKSIPSCCNKGWLHVNCMRKAAMSAGYLFKCPLCGRENDAYLVVLRKRGIFIPERDASWELSQNAFGSLLYKYSSCDAKNCFCPNGREFVINLKRSKWFLLKCIYCGSKGIHFGCSPSDLKEYKCDDCTVPRSQMQASQSIQSQQRQKNTCKALAAENNIVDLTVDENSNEAGQQSVINVCSETSQPSSIVRSHEITSSSVDNMCVIEDDVYPLVSVAEYSENPFKDRAIILAADMPPPGTQYVDDNKKLSQERLNLWLSR